MSAPILRVHRIRDGNRSKAGAELRLKFQGTPGLVSVAGYAHGSVAVLDSLEADAYAVEKPFAIVQDLGPIQAADSRIRGVLGESFLSHFDLLIDYPHSCFVWTR